ncbi:MAG: threonine transporter RhtB [Betaproteobacteria bacterium]|nr:threonine transporter RhtB [Betaproteobacteria bacterium]
MTFPTWLAFFAACWAISISPGAGALAAMTSGLNHGLKRGLITVPGLILGIWTQLLIVGVGLGALVATSTAAFEIVRWGGVAYLVYLGIQQWRAPPRDWTAATESGYTPAKVLIARAWAVNAVNPKGTVFFLAVVPQFLNLEQALIPQYLLIGLTLSLTDLVIMTGYTALAARVLRALRSPAQQRLINHAFGGLFVAAGVLLAIFQR